MLRQSSALSPGRRLTMFLFTTPTSPSPAPPAPPTGTAAASPVIDAIRQGAQATGTSFDYLLKTAKRESALDPSAKAPTSSATGLFQFIEQTWLGLVKTDGNRLGLGDEAKAITARQDGGFTVSNPEARQTILDLRKDPQVASAMAGALTKQNRDALVASTGREPSAGDLYVAHVLGARGAASLISAAGTDPTRPAATDFPEAARANRSIFYDKSGRARGVGEVYALIGAAQAGPSASPPLATPATASAGPMDPGYQPSGLQGIFQTGNRPGPLSDAVARIWRTNNATRNPATSAVRFYPKSDIQVATSEPTAEEPAPSSSASAGRDEPAPPSAATATGIQVDIPLPPIRPAFVSDGSRPGGAGMAAKPLYVGLSAKARTP